MSNVTKQAIKQSFADYWWIYLVVAVLLCSVWLYAFYLKDKIRDNERLQIFVAGQISDRDLERRAEEYFANDGILDVNLYVLSPDFKGFEAGFSAQGFLNSDLLVLPQSLVEKYAAYALALDGVITLPDDAETYSTDGKIYAVKVGMVNSEGYTPLYGFGWIDGRDEDMYVLVSPKSQNIGKLNPDGNADDKHALQLLQMLLNNAI
uniref:hypothetical protein n=1 Tax=Candidatus Fimenecus sp. TaxID=3022888 RepID=UPI0040296D21